MNAPALIDSLARFPDRLVAVVTGIAPGDARWRPADGSWSIVEIVRHLGDEEIEDFGRRLRLTLDDPSADWPPIDPEGWAVSRGYRDADWPGTVETFVAARADSVRWLRALDAPDWSREHAHPTIGPLRAGDLLAAWCDHDVLHLRQIAKRLHGLTVRNAGVYSTRYAGSW